MSTTQSDSSFSLQYPVVSLRSSSSCLCHLLHIPVTSVLPSTICFRRQFIDKMWPFQLAVLFTLCRLLHPWLCVILLHFPHEQPNWFSPAFSSTTFQNFPGISVTLPKLSKYKYVALKPDCKSLFYWSTSKYVFVCWIKKVIYQCGSVVEVCPSFNHLNKVLDIWVLRCWKPQGITTLDVQSVLLRQIV